MGQWLQMMNWEVHGKSHSLFVDRVPEFAMTNWFMGYLMTLFNCIGYVTWQADHKQWIEKAYFQALSQYSPGRTEENLKTPS
jgi:hypothetical protein